MWIFYNRIKNDSQLLLWPNSFLVQMQLLWILSFLKEARLYRLILWRIQWFCHNISSCPLTKKRGNKLKVHRTQLMVYFLKVRVSLNRRSFGQNFPICSFQPRITALLQPCNVTLAHEIHRTLSLNIGLSVTWQSIWYLNLKFIPLCSIYLHENAPTAFKRKFPDTQLLTLWNILPWQDFPFPIC